MADFIDWLTAEMARLNVWNNELARRMEVSSSYVSDMLTRKRTPHYEFCIGVARALQYQPVIVLRRAGLIPEDTESEESVLVAEGKALLESLSPPLQPLALALLRDLKSFDTQPLDADVSSAPES